MIVCKTQFVPGSERRKDTGHVNSIDKQVMLSGLCRKKNVSINLSISFLSNSYFLNLNVFFPLSDYIFV